LIRRQVGYGRSLELKPFKGLVPFEEPEGLDFQGNQEVVLDNLDGAVQPELYEVLASLGDVEFRRYVCEHGSGEVDLFLEVVVVVQLAAEVCSGNPVQRLKFKLRLSLYRW